MSVKPALKKECNDYWERKEFLIQATFLGFTTVLIAASTQSSITSLVMLTLGYNGKEISKQTQFWNDGRDIALVGIAATLTVYAGFATAKTIWKRFTQSAARSASMKAASRLTGNSTKIDF